MKKLFVFALATAIIFSSCSNEPKTETTGSGETATTTESKEERNKKVIKDGLNYFLANDMDKVVNDVAPTFTDHMDGSMPPITNRDTLKASLTAVKNSIPDYKGDNLMYFADGDYVLVVGDWSGTFKNDLMGMKATGKTFKMKDVDIFKLNDDGKITEHWSIQNLGAILMAPPAK